MSEKLPASTPWDLITKKNAGIVTPAELITLAQWLVQNDPPGVEILNQIDVPFADEAAKTAWLRMQQRSKRLAIASANWLVSYGNTLLPITAAEVAHFVSCLDHVTLTTQRGQTYSVALILDELETTIDAHRFFRANQSALVARASIAQTAILPGGRLLVQLTPPAPQQVVVSQTRAAAFKAWLNAV